MPPDFVISLYADEISNSPYTLKILFPSLKMDKLSRYEKTNLMMH